ncbi:EAL domain-containing protein [uncultured Paraglaciecola sp.]|uniref:putative bifunctional diguanylate cyclase/phosphodiesterase n=1 Tax=uncultured Paraglaciecola sp. TaxID=1765024 RepID=UPI0030D6E800|tara:strand:- start:70428 stop:72368 length:1941 start_codon:yes stop_codon:yes gene_type:complete
MLGEAASLQKAYHKDSADLLYGNAKAGIWVTLVASSLLVFGFDTAEIQIQKYIWWLCMTLLMLIRMIDVYRWNKSDQLQKRDPQQAIKHFILGTFSTGIMWCVYCLFVLHYADNTELACMIIVVSALAGGAATVLAAHKITAMSYALIMLAPFSIGMLLSLEQYQQILGVLGLAFSVVMVITAKKSADFTLNAIRLKNENATLVDQMEQKVVRRTAKIYELSNLDALTGLFNRSAFLHHLEKQLWIAQKDNVPVALLFIDLDGFKKINDTLGHEIGNKVLKQTAMRLQNFPDQAHLLCRWGGDEFLIAIMNADQDTAINYANDLITKISEYYDFENNRLSIGATIGIAMYPAHALQGDELIQLADTAMYCQKKNSPCSVGLFNKEMGLRLFREQKLKRGLAEAIEKQQLRLVYQPIVDSVSHQVVAFEALLRWNFDGENVPPSEFITIAEQYGLINSIGDWVLLQSCIAANQWINASNKAQPSVSVNVSVLQLHNASFIEFVQSVLSRAQLDAEKLTIEITESIFSNDKAIIFQRIKELQAMGIKVSIDDFGTEYSSLSVIQDLAANTIKIDRSFVKKLDTNGMAIIEAVKQMASTLNYAVIAEGVETQQQAEILSGLGIEMLQGYYFAKPIELSKVNSYISEHSR